MMRKAFLAFLLLAVPLLVVPWAVSFDSSKAALLAAGALVLAAMSLPKRDGEGRGRFDFRWSPASAAAAACWIALAASAPRGPDPWAALRILALLLAAGTFASAVENAVFSAADLLPLAGAAVAASGIGSAYGLAQALGWDFPFPWNEGGSPVPASTHGNPNFAAEFTAASLPLAVLLAARGRWSGWASLLLGCAFLFAARGRGAILGLAAGCAAAGALALLPRRRALALAAGAGILAASAGAGAWVLARGGEIPAWMGRSDTVVVRTDLARGTARMLLDHPLGVGAGNWEAAHPPYRAEREYRASLFRDPGEAHADPLQFAAEGGWPAAAALAALAVLLVLAAARAVSAGEDRGLALAFAATLGATAGASLVSAPFHRPASLLLAAFAAGGLAFLGGGRSTTLGRAGSVLHRLLVVLLAGAALLLAVRMIAEGPQSEGRAVEREEDPLPWERAAAARELFARAVRFDPGAAEALARAGEVSLKMGAAASTPERGREEYGRALAFLDALLGLRPLDPLVLSHRSEALSRLGDDAAAEAGWRRALEIAPWHRDARQALASFLLRKGRAADALPLAEGAAATDPRWPPAAATLVEVLFALGREEDSRVAAAGAIDRILGAGDLAGASTVARRASATSLGTAASLCGKATRLIEGGGVPAGSAVLEGVLAARPTEEFLERGAQALTAAGRLPEAALFRVEARLVAAAAALEAGDRERAAAEVRRALEVRVPTEEMRRNRARAASLLARAGKREEALGALAVGVDRGYADGDALEADPAFAPLRDDPAFRGLVRRARANAQK